MSKIAPEPYPTPAPTAPPITAPLTLFFETMAPATAPEVAPIIAPFFLFDHFFLAGFDSTELVFVVLVVSDDTAAPLLSSALLFDSASFSVYSMLVESTTVSTTASSTPGVFTSDFGLVQLAATTNPDINNNSFFMILICLYDINILLLLG